MSSKRPRCTGRHGPWRHGVVLRTTLNISAEAMARVRQLAQQRAMPLGTIVSELIMEALQPKHAPTIRNGVPLFPVAPGTPPDLELVNRLRDGEP